MSGDGRAGTTRAALEALRAAFATGDAQRIAAVLHPDFEIEQPASLPHGGTHRGLAGMGEMGAAFAAVWTRAISEPTEWISDDTAAQLTTQTWTSIATGRSATVDVVELITVEDGLVRRIRVFQHDTALLLATLDAPAS